MAKLLLDQLEYRFDPRHINLPCNPPPEEALALMNEDEDWTIFDKTLETNGNISANFRIFVNSIKPHLIQDTAGNQAAAIPTRGNHHNITLVYTDGSCDKNGKADTRAGGGVWYGNDDPLNSAIRVSKDLPQTNNTGEMLAIYHAAKNAPSDTTLCIISDSKWAIQALTTNLAKNTDQGYIFSRNPDLIQATAATLKARQGHTLLKWVKGHNGNIGNEGADRLAAEGAQKDEDEADQLFAPTHLIPPGIKLEAASQAVMYRALRVIKSPALNNRTKAYLELT